MALISCPECNHTVSDQANTCPHCGYPIKKQGTKALIITFVAPKSFDKYLGRSVSEYIQSFVKALTEGNEVAVQDVRYGEMLYSEYQVTQNITIVHTKIDSKWSTIKVNVKVGIFGNVKLDETWG